MYEYWFIDGEHAVTIMPTGSEYDFWLRAPKQDWLTHMARKSWVTQPMLDELRQLLVDHDCYVPECRILSFANSVKRQEAWPA